jgi:TonB family protein
MIKVFMTLLLSLLVVGTVFPQTSTDAPIEWVTYKINDHKLSISFPKLPIRYDQTDHCNEKRTEYFTSYAREVVYTLTVVRREKPKFSMGLCTSTSKFGRVTLEARRAELGKDAQLMSTSDQLELWLRKTDNQSSKIWLLDDLKKDRWIELKITARAEISNADDFVRSLELTPNGNGVEVGDGASQILGDRAERDVDTRPASGSSTTSQEGDAKGHTDVLMIVSKVKARYTDAARTNGEQGQVTLRVTFLANGGIGDIQTIKGLKYGLTEQAMAAARKMVFLPEKKDGLPRATSRPVTFSFSIY